MTEDEIQSELTECLKLQQELETREDELVTRFKRILEACKDSPNRILVKIEGEVYQLQRLNLTQDAIESARKHGGFYSQYRLAKLGARLCHLQRLLGPATCTATRTSLMEMLSIAPQRHRLPFGKKSRLPTTFAPTVAWLGALVRRFKRVQ